MGTPIQLPRVSEPETDFNGFEPYVDEVVVARFLDLEPRRILELARANQLPAHPIGKTRMTWRFRLSEVEVYLNPQQQRSTGKMPVAVPRTKERNRLG